MDRIDSGRWRRQPPACQSVSFRVGGQNPRKPRGAHWSPLKPIRSVQWTYLKKTDVSPYRVIPCHSVSPDLRFRGSTVLPCPLTSGLFSRCSLKSELLLRFSYIGNVLLKGVLIGGSLQIDR